MIQIVRPGKSEKTLRFVIRLTANLSVWLWLHSASCDWPIEFSSLYGDVNDIISPTDGTSLELTDLRPFYTEKWNLRTPWLTVTTGLTRFRDSCSRQRRRIWKLCSSLPISLSIGDTVSSFHSLIFCTSTISNKAVFIIFRKEAAINRKSWNDGNEMRV